MWDVLKQLDEMRQSMSTATAWGNINNSGDRSVVRPDKSNGTTQWHAHGPLLLPTLLQKSYSQKASTASRYIQARATRPPSNSNQEVARCRWYRHLCYMCPSCSRLPAASLTSCQTQANPSPKLDPNHLQLHASQRRDTSAFSDVRGATHLRSPKSSKCQSQHHCRHCDQHNGCCRA